MSHYYQENSYKKRNNGCQSKAIEQIAGNVFFCSKPIDEFMKENNYCQYIDAMNDQQTTDKSNNPKDFWVANICVNLTKKLT